MHFGYNTIIVISAVSFEIPYIYNSGAQMVELQSPQDNWNGTVPINLKLAKFIDSNANITMLDATEAALNDVGKLTKALF
jgi:hypothetical protein